MNPNNFCIILVLAVLVLAGPVGAKPENIIMGPYNVSFDMGNVAPYTINLLTIKEHLIKGKDSFPAYHLIINETSSMKQADIGIITSGYQAFIADYSPPIWNNLEEAIRNEMKLTPSYCDEPVIKNLMIDGKQGVLGSIYCLFPTMHYDFGYPLDYYPKNNTSLVLVYSTYPWDEGTSELVKTIHVEKA